LFFCTHQDKYSLEQIPYDKWESQIINDYSNNLHLCYDLDNYGKVIYLLIYLDEDIYCNLYFRFIFIEPAYRKSKYFLKIMNEIINAVDYSKYEIIRCATNKNNVYVKKLLSKLKFTYSHSNETNDFFTTSKDIFKSNGLVLKSFR